MKERWRGLRLAPSAVCSPLRKSWDFLSSGTPRGSTRLRGPSRAVLGL